MPQSTVEKLALNAVIHVCRHAEITFDQLARLNEVANRVMADEALVDVARQDCKQATSLMTTNLGTDTYLRPRPVVGLKPLSRTNSCNRLNSALYSVGGGGLHIVKTALDWMTASNKQTFVNFLWAVQDIDPKHPPSRVSPDFVGTTLMAVLKKESMHLDPKALRNIFHSIQNDNRCAGVAADVAQWAMDNLKEDWRGAKWHVVDLLLVNLPLDVASHLYYEPHEIQRLDRSKNTWKEAVADPRTGQLKIWQEKYELIHRDKNLTSRAERLKAHAKDLQALKSSPAPLSEAHTKKSLELAKKFEALSSLLLRNAERYEQFKASAYYGAAHDMPLDEAMENYDATVQSEELGAQSSADEPQAGGEAELASVDENSGESLQDQSPASTSSDPPVTGSLPLIPDRKEPEPVESTPPTVRFDERQKLSSGKSTARQWKDSKERDTNRLERQEQAAQARLQPEGRVQYRHKTFGSLPRSNTLNPKTGRIKSDGKHHDPRKNKSLTTEQRKLWGRPSKLVMSQV